MFDTKLPDLRLSKAVCLVMTPAPLVSTDIFSISTEELAEIVVKLPAMAVNSTVELAPVMTVAPSGNFMPGVRTTGSVAPGIRTEAEPFTLTTLASVA